MRAEVSSRVESNTTLHSALRAARMTLASSETADLDAQTLLAHVLGVDRSYLFARAETFLTAEQSARCQAAVDRRAAGEPIAYITGAKGFYDIELRVSPAVLIPRPETELLLEEALRLTERGAGFTVADIGTGSGALAIAFARQRPAAKVYASEISRAALEIARQNAERNHAQVCFCEGDLAAPLIERGLHVDLLMANLPYIASGDLAALEVSRFEPRLALDGGADGLDLIRRLLTQIPSVCSEGAWALLEIGAEQGESVAGLVRDCVGARCDILQDYAGLDRIARFRV
ncbi:MAG: peptide chain release factor N(5)-glutamine methyltransferase [Chloroflexi bacterium]|nr:peptide chain release factor N(5)-glutamine methyltransferase [Chloroflexota bacterium]